MRISRNYKVEDWKQLSFKGQADWVKGVSRSANSRPHFGYATVAISLSGPRTDTLVLVPARFPMLQILVRNARTKPAWRAPRLRPRTLHQKRGPHIRRHCGLCDY